MASRLQYAPCNVDPRQIQHERACDEKWGHSHSIFDPVYLLGGRLNMLMYPRPNIAALQRREKDLSWIGALFHVIRAGEEIPKHSPAHFLCCCAKIEEESEDASNEVGSTPMQNHARKRIKSQHLGVANGCAISSG